jgi:GR25 family glycosyltransferase involved in LPS biosynthesis
MTMPPTYCITCPQTGRTADAEAHFAARGLSVVMVRGVHGRSWGLKTEKFAHTRGEGYVIPAGYVGLNLSHWMVWQYCWLAGHDEVLILEDDCNLGANFADEFRRTYAALPADWQVFYVGTVGSEHKPRRVVNVRLAVVDYPFGTHCYMVRRAALPVLLEHCQEARSHIDLQMYENAVKGRLSHYTAWPNLADQHSAEGRWPGTCG